MSATDDVLTALRTWGRQPAGELVSRLGISRPTLMRAVRALGTGVVSLGSARRTAYAARRAIRGSLAPLPLYSVDAAGTVNEVATVYPTHPAGCAVSFAADPGWPLDDAMQDGWFDGVPYMLDDMRPQGFLGRNFARAHAVVLQVPDDPVAWGDDDVLHALSLLGTDQPGCFILGEVALRSWLSRRSEINVLGAKNQRVQPSYVDLAARALAQGVPYSSAGGEFPKFTAVRTLAGQPAHVLVKFSGSDASPGTRRWSDLLVCEHLASRAIRDHLGLAATESQILHGGGRTFLEVVRFDRHGMHGRSAVCSWAAINGALTGLGPKPWTVGAQALHQRGWIHDNVRAQIERLWHFGHLIGNTDMHDGNLAFRPGLQLAPVYDMLPMVYAPQRGVELPSRTFAPAPPIPSERAAWHMARTAAVAFWDRAASDARISEEFRAICAANAQHLSGVTG